MIRLNLQAARPRWVDLGHGVRVHVLPVDSLAIARAQGVAELRALVDEDGRIADQAAFSVGAAKIVAQTVITEWEGVADENGRPIKPTPENISALLDLTPLFMEFDRQVMAPAMLLDAEKNASAPLPNGPSARAPRTAPTAGKPARTARRK